MVKLLKEKLKMFIVILMLVLNIDLIVINNNKNKLNFINTQIKIELNNNKFITTELLQYLKNENISFDYELINNRINYSLTYENKVLNILLSEEVIIKDSFNLN